MIKISYLKPSIVLSPEDSEDNNDLIGALQSSGISEQLIRYDNKNYSWLINESALNKLNMALLPVKSKLQKDQTFCDWITEKTAPPEMREAVIRVGAVMSKIKRGEQPLPHGDIENVAKYFWKAAPNHPKYKSGKWDGYIMLYKKWNGEFPTGLLSDVLAVLDKSKIKYKIEYTFNPKPEKEYEWTITDGLIPDPDQLDAIEAALSEKRGILKAPTGFGKTALLAKRMIVGFGVTTLFVANKKSLLDDAADDFQNGVVDSSGKPLSCLTIKDGMFGNVKLPCDEKSLKNALNAPVIVATIQSLHARLKDERTKDVLTEWLKFKCKLVCIDETQAIGTKIWDEVLDNCYAPYRFGLSATPRRTDGATIKLIASTGPIIFSTTAEKQIEQGRLCDLDINYQVFDHGLFNLDDSGLNYNEAYRTCIVENESRNINAIINPALEMVEEGRHVLVLIQLIDHGHILKDKFIEAGIDPQDIRFIWGDTPDKIRKSAILEFRKGDFKIMIGSTIFDAGVNIPLISGVVLGGAGNSDITLIQRIGRGARNCDYEDILGYIPEFMKENHNKKVTKVYDVVDNNAKFFSKQSKNRYYNACAEFGKDRVHIIGGDKSVLRRQYKSNTHASQHIDQAAAQEKMLQMFGKNLE